MKAWQMVSIGALVAAVAFPAEAQFTTAVIPPKRPQPAEQPMAAGDTARRDTTVVARLTDMKAWVDSAAGALAVRPAGDSAYVDSVAIAGAVAVDTMTAQDTSMRVVAAGEIEPDRRGRRGARRFADGAPAPDTASPLALLVALGAGSLAAGAWLRRR